MRHVFFLICAGLLWACSNEPRLKGAHVEIAKQQASGTTLLFSGVVQPAHVNVLPCPADGVITDVRKTYGSEVHAGEVLFIMTSSRATSDYKLALFNFLKAKSDLNLSQTQWEEARFLHQHELISDDDFKARQAAYFASHLAYLQAKDLLDDLMRQLNRRAEDVYTLNIADIDKVDAVLHLPAQGEVISVKAPCDGILLSAHVGDEGFKKIKPGSPVKQGDALAIIGDMTGISIPIRVNEMTVNQLQPGQAVTITGLAFSGEMLQGIVHSVDKQADTTASGQPAFEVNIAVPKLTSSQQSLIRVGMNAQVDIHPRSEAQLVIPIRAVTIKQGETFVNVIDKTSRVVRAIPVKTGATTQDTVVIIAGMHAGDSLVVPD